MAEIGFTLARAAQGRGLTAEAVALALRLVWNDSSAARVVAITDTRNGGALRLLDRLGFRRTATLEAGFRGERCLEQHFVMHRQGRAAPSLRPALAADAAAAAEVLIEARRVLMPFAPSAHPESDVRRWVGAVRLPAGGVTVAELDGAVAGVLALPQTDGVAWIDQLSVHPAQVGRGIGAALLRHALALQPRPLRLFTFQANLHARAFYERQGFVALQFSDGAGNEEHRADVLYELSR